MSLERLVEQLLAQVEALEARVAQAEADAADALDIAVDEPLAVHDLGGGMRTSQFVFGGSGSGGSVGTVDYPFKTTIETNAEGASVVRVRGGRVRQSFVNHDGAVWNYGGKGGMTILAGDGWTGSEEGDWVSSEVKSDAIGVVYTPASGDDDACYKLEWLGGTGGLRDALEIATIGIDSAGAVSVQQHQVGDFTQTLTLLPSPLMQDSYGRVVQEVGVWKHSGSDELAFASDTSDGARYTYALSAQEKVLTWNGAQDLEAKTVTTLFGAASAGFSLTKKSVDGLSKGLTYKEPSSEEGFGQMDHRAVSMTFWSDTEPTVGEQEILLLTAIEDANEQTTYESNSGSTSSTESTEASTTEEA